MRVSVATFGEVLWDLFEIGPDTYRRELGGAPSNLAIGLARLGVRVAVVGAVGADAFGEALVRRLREERVDTSLIARLPNRTGLAFVHRDARGEPSFLFYRHDTADMAIRPKDVRPVKAKYIACGTSTLLDEGLRRATERFVRLGKRAGAVLAVDLNVRTHLWKSPRVMRDPHRRPRA